MNESDYIRQQLRAERSHLREVLELAPQAPATALAARDRYLAWGARRQHEIQQRHLALLAAKAIQVRTASSAVLSNLLAATEELESLADPVYGIADWRRAAQLSADAILEERRLYGAARA